MNFQALTEDTLVKAKDYILTSTLKKQVIQEGNIAWSNPPKK